MQLTQLSKAYEEVVYDFLVSLEKNQQYYT